MSVLTSTKTRLMQEKQKEFQKTLEDMRKIYTTRIAELETKINLFQREGGLAPKWILDKKYLSELNNEAVRLLTFKHYLLESQVGYNWALGARREIKIKYMTFRNGFTEKIHPPIRTNGWLIKELGNGGRWGWYFLDDHGNALQTPHVFSNGSMCLGDNKLAIEANRNTGSYKQFFDQLNAVITIMQYIGLDGRQINYEYHRYFSTRLTELVLKNREKGG